jgi:hypothetical protein
LRLVEQGLRESSAGLLAGGKQAALRMAQLLQIEFLKQFVDTPAQGGNAVKQPEDAQILDHGQIAGEGGVDRGEIGARQGACAIFAMSMPSISTLPLVADRTPSTMLMVVVLPAPLGPSRPRISPLFTVKETSSRAVTLPYTLLKARARSAGNGGLACLEGVGMR